MNLPQKLRLQKELLDFNAEGPDYPFDLKDLFESCMNDLKEIGFTEDESLDIIFDIKYNK